MSNFYIAPGPIFEPESGWGGKLKKWSKKYILGGDCALCRATRYVLVFAVIVLLAGWPKFNMPQPKPPENKITETVQPKDGKTHLARRVLTKYLNQNQILELTNGQKIFIETVLREKMPDEAVNQIGSEVKIEQEEIKRAINQAEQLSPLQLKKWESYAQRVNFSN